MKFKPDHYEWRSDCTIFEQDGEAYADSFRDIILNHSDEWDDWSWEQVIVEDKTGKQYTIEIYSYEDWVEDDFWMAWDFDLPIVKETGKQLCMSDIVKWKYDPEFYTNGTK